MKIYVAYFSFMIKYYEIFITLYTIEIFAKEMQIIFNMKSHHKPKDLRVWHVCRKSESQSLFNDDRTIKSNVIFASALFRLKVVLVYNFPQRFNSQVKVPSGLLYADPLGCHHFRLTILDIYEKSSLRCILCDLLHNMQSGPQ